MCAIEKMCCVDLALEPRMLKEKNSLGVKMLKSGKETRSVDGEEGGEGGENCFQAGETQCRVLSAAAQNVRCVQTCGAPCLESLILVREEYESIVATSIKHLLGFSSTWFAEAPRPRV